jgi:nicotinate phosphoribosyltransferase
VEVAAPLTSPLLVDLYQLTMGQSYVAEGKAERPATFSLFFRSLPRGWGYALAAGLDSVLAYLEELRFAEADVAYLDSTGLFGDDFLDRLRRLRFSGDLRALPEGTVFFPHEPVLELTAPVLEAQLAETMVLNLAHLETLIASKAARSVDAARGRQLVDFSLRRTHGGEAGLKVARSSYLAGFDATSNVLAGHLYGIPIAGTMAHSYVESFDDELEAFRAYARAFPDRAILLVDTYDVIEGTRRAIEVGRELAAQGHRLRGVRIDSGDLAELSRRARALLDEAGFADAIVFVSGGLDERDLERLLHAGAPIGGFGVGSMMGTAADSPFLDMAYKLVEFDGRPTLKLSAGKATLPGRKQVWRLDGHDLLGLAEGPAPEEGTPLLVDVMRAGRRTRADRLEDARARARNQREALDAGHRRVDSQPYEVRLDDEVARLRRRLTGGGNA